MCALCTSHKSTFYAYTINNFSSTTPTQLVPSVRHFVCCLRLDYEVERRNNNVLNLLELAYTFVVIAPALCL